MTFQLLTNRVQAAQAFIQRDAAHPRFREKHAAILDDVRHEQTAETDAQSPWDNLQKAVQALNRPEPSSNTYEMELNKIQKELEKAYLSDLSKDIHLHRGKARQNTMYKDPIEALESHWPFHATAAAKIQEAKAALKIQSQHRGKAGRKKAEAIRAQRQAQKTPAAVFQGEPGTEEISLPSLLRPRKDGPHFVAGAAQKVQNLKPRSEDSDISDLCMKLDGLLEELDHAVNSGDAASSRQLREKIKNTILTGPFDTEAYQNKLKEMAKEIRKDLENGNCRYKQKKGISLEDRHRLPFFYAAKYKFFSLLSGKKSALSSSILTEDTPELEMPDPSQAEERWYSL